MSDELDRHTIDTQDEIINDLREENSRLREEIKDLKAVVRSYQLGWNEE